MVNDRYPIGKSDCPEVISTEKIEVWINEISTLPARLKEVLKNLDDDVQNCTYREGGWTIRQLVHHIADSHINAYVRFKLALTEENPTVKPYAEDIWAELPDSQLPIISSLKMIEALHERWVYLLKNVTEEQLKRTFIHPDSGVVSVVQIIGLYAWHGNHHLAHIKNALKQL